jgi:hypothetical protein
MAGRVRGWARKKICRQGEKLVARFRPFLEDLVASDLSPKTIQRHIDNLWALGGEIIRDLNENPSLRRKRIEQILDDRIDDEGGRACLRHGIGRAAPALPRFHLPEAPPVPQPIVLLNRKITHRFPQRGSF